MTAAEFVQETKRLGKLRDADGVIELRRLHYLDVMLDLTHQQWVLVEAEMKWARRICDPEQYARMHQELIGPMYEKLRAQDAKLRGE